MISTKVAPSYVIRTPYMMAIDLVGIVLVFLVSFLLRYESLSTLSQNLSLYWLVLIAAVGVRLGLYWISGLYSRMWRYASVREAIHILESATLATIFLASINWLILPQLNIAPISSYAIFILDWVFNIAYLGMTRLGLRIGLRWLVSHHKRNVLAKLSPHNNVLIFGAGEMGAVVSRLIQDNPEMGLKIAGFVDDAPGKQSMQFRGISVLGTRQDIPRLAREFNVNEVIIAMSTAPEPVIDDVVDLCASANLPNRIIPNICDLLAGTISVNQMRQWRPSHSQHSQPMNGHSHSRPLAVEKPVFHNILVTGGAGFIGANFVRYMLEKYPNYTIVVFDKLTYAGNPDNLLGLKEEYSDRYVFVKGDICNREQVAAAMTTYQIDAIVNFAAESHVDRSLLEPDAFIETNVRGVHNLLEASRQFEVRRFHQVSTDEVYGEVRRGSFSEQDPLETRSPYSASKAGADLLAHAYFTSFGVPITTTRGSNNIGPYQYLEKAVPVFVTNAIDDLPLPVYGDGLYVRDYQHVIDHCRGVDVVMHRGVPGEIYNLASGNERTTIELAKEILDRLFKPHSLIHLVADRPGQDRRYSVNTAKIRALGWKPEWPFARALDATVEWYVENEWWWRKIKSGEFKQYYEKQFNKRLDEAVRFVLSRDESES
jgi:dTDP-glucose 4,6-dehydratase